MNWHKVLAALGQGLVAGAVYIGGTTGHVMGIVGGLLNMIARADAVAKPAGAIQRKIDKKPETELPEPTA